jgi:CO/xanthine dehydrogenase FAD-binding subunit
VAGCTDVGLWVTKQHRDFAKVLDVTRVAELRRVERYPHHIAIGAAVTLADAFDALVADRPQLQSFAHRFAGLPVRNSGTLGGNVANGSPIGDSMPLLIALGAHVVLMSQRQGKTRSRELPLEALYTGYRQNVMAADEVLAWIKVPLPEPAEFLRVYKISKRFEDDISAVCLAISLHREDGRIRRVSIGAGGVAATPARARQTEAACSAGPPTAPPSKPRPGCCRPSFSPSRTCAPRPPTDASAGQPGATLWPGDSGPDQHLDRIPGAGGSGMSAPHTIKAASSAPACGSSQPHESAAAQVAGAATYVDDIAEVRGTLHAAPILSPVAHGRLKGVDPAPRWRCPACAAWCWRRTSPATRSWPPLPTTSPSSPSTRWSTSAASSAWWWPTP